MHQIRVHFKYIGHPVAGDKTYASRRVLSTLPLSRHFLHASALSFSLPDGKMASFSSPLPGDLKRVLRGLARRSTSAAAERQKGKAAEALYRGLNN